MTTVYVAENEEYRLTIEVDEDAPNPRTDSEPMGTMICWHRRYDLGDKHSFYDPSDFLVQLAGEVYRGDDNVYEMDDRALWAIVNDHYVVLPIFMYEHSDVTLRTRPYGDPWDSGQVGYIYMTMNQVRAEYGDTSPESIERARKYMTGEVDEYAKYVNGDVYGFVLERKTQDGEYEEIDSCWGFYGTEWHENGLAAQMREDVAYLVDELTLV